MFSSLHKQIAIGVLCVGCSILGSAALADCQADTVRVKTISGEYELEEVVVSAPLNPLIQSQLMRSVSVISRQEIERSPAQDLASLLQYQAGVDLRQRGSFGMQADVSLRGGSFDQTLVLLNGISMSDPQTGHHLLNLPLDLQSIERIEILHGAAARVFGPNAFSGAINIITKTPEEAILNTTLSAGDYGYGMAGASLELPGNISNHFLSVNGMTSDGYTNNTDFRSASMYYRVKTELPGVESDIQLGYSNRAFGANSFYTPMYPDQFEQTETTFLSLRLTPDQLPLQASFYWRRHGDRFELFRYDAPDWYRGHNHHRSDVIGGQLHYNYTGRFGVSSVGLDARREGILSNVLGLPLAKPVAVSGQNEVLYTHSYRRNGLSLMAGQSLFSGPFSMSAGMLVYFSSDLDDRYQLFPGLDLSWQISRRLRWYATGNHTLRLPTFTDMFYKGPVNAGNELLKPEKALSVETGIKGELRAVYYEGFVFKRWGKEMIDWVMYPGDDKWRSENLTQVQLSGFGIIFYVPFLSLSASQLPSQGEAVKVSYHYIRGEKPQKAFVSNYVFDYLRHQIVLSANRYMTPRLGLGFSVSWQDREGEYMLYQDGEFAGMKQFEPFWIMDVGMFFDTRRLQWFAEASNILDTTVVNHANVPQPGRWFRAGVRGRFHLQRR